MIEAQELTGYISQDKVLTGELSKTIEVLKPITQEKEVIPTKETQIIEPDKDFTGLSKVTVQSIPNEYIIPSGEIEFTQNGTYDVTDKASAKVNIKEKVLGTKTITSNGTYKAIDDNLDGYSQVEVATSGVDINEYMSDTINSGSSGGSWVKLILKLRSPIIITTTNYQNMFSGYLGQTIPALICEKKPTKTNAMFKNCENIISVPEIDTSDCTDFSYMCQGCSSLLEVPYLDITKANYLSYMFEQCRALKKIPQYDFSNAKYIHNIFCKCSNLEEVPLLNMQNVASTGWPNGFIDECANLTTLGGFQNLGQGYSTTITENSSDTTLKLRYSTKLTHESLMNVINNLYDIKTKGVKPQQLVLGSTNLSKLTSEEIAIATNKGWTVS